MGYSTGVKDVANVAAPDAVKVRRRYSLTDEIKELWGDEAPFLTLTANSNKKPTSDPEPRKLVHKSGWADRRFYAAGIGTWSASANGATITSAAVELTVGGSDNVGFLIPRLTCRAKTSGGDTIFVIDTVTSQQSVNLVSISSSPNNLADGTQIQVIGTAFARGSDKATATYDVVDYEATATQIFKTVIDVTGTLAATELFGINEYDRLTADKMKEHVTDIERGLLFGQYIAGGTTVGTDTVFSTYGIVTFVEDNSSLSTIKTPSYAAYAFDDFVDDMEDWYTKGGNRATNEKLFLVGSSVVSFFSKIGSGKLWANGTVNFESGQTEFGVNVTQVKHPFGTLNLVHEPLFRGDSATSFYKDYAVGVDLANYEYRPLIGNGVDRDTHMIENLQTTNDKIVDQILTEVAGHPTLPETHSLFKFTA